MKLKLDSEEDISKDDLFTLEVFFGDISLSDLLVINKMIVKETNDRIDIIDKRMNKKAR
ncbi:MAG: hypothetical protein KAJ93_01205 [Methanosarcinales archaeon]|nr:hypothetical protein [Methanosarcinales archaeon]